MEEPSAAADKESLPFGTRTSRIALQFFNFINNTMNIKTIIREKLKERFKPQQGHWFDFVEVDDEIEFEYSRNNWIKGVVTDMDSKSVTVKTKSGKDYVVRSEHNVRLIGN
jgi:hypothetical protein